MTISASDLSFSHDEKPALLGVCATFAPGKLSVILGPNGAGKSTLLACLAGLQQPDAGDALLGNSSIADMPAKLRAKAISLLPQSAETHWAINSEALVALGRYPHSSGVAADLAAIDAAMVATATGAFKGRPVTHLSGGERARVLLARVLAGEPQWILADEPLANLDPGFQIDMLELLCGQAQKGVGVIAVLHDLHHAARYADDIVLLHQGRVAAHGSPASVLSKEILAAVYGIDVDAAEDDTGKVQLIVKGRAIP